MKNHRALAPALAFVSILASQAHSTPRNLEFGPYLMAGYDHAMVVDARSNLRVWGKNTYAQLGFAAVSQNSPIPSMNYLGDYCQVRQVTGSSRGEHSYAMGTDGTLQGWGRNDYGQLGLGNTTSPILYPTQVGYKADWRYIAIGRLHTLGIRPDGNLYAWGRNNAGQLGINNKTNKSTPTLVSNTGDWIAVAAGEDFSLALKANGDLYAWGSNANNRLGQNNTSVTEKLTPALVTGGGEYVKIAAGYNSCAALKGNGTLWTWGGNENGQLGRTGNTNAPGQVGTSIYRDIAVGGNFCVAIRDDGDLYSWGKNNYGQLGDNSYTNRAAPVAVKNSLHNNLSVVAGDKFAVVMRADGTLWSWGINTDGQMGRGDLVSSNVPAPILPHTWDGYAGLRQGVLAAGRYHSMAIMSDGTLWGWGSNQFGRAALGGSSQANSPTPIGLGTDRNWLTLSVGVNHGLAVKADGTLWGWGDNSYSSLQGPPTASQLIPKQLTLAGNGWATAVAAGSGASFGLKTNGQLWAWGYNGNNQLPAGAIGATPVQVGSDKRWVSISAGDDYVEGITADGQLWGWGRNASGQIGDNTTTNRTSGPVPVRLNPSTVDRNWVSVAAGYGTTNACRANGTLYGWGTNSAGESGLGDVLYQVSKPTQVIQNLGGTLDNQEWQVMSKALSAQYTMSVDNDGHMDMWGWNNSGQFGFSTSSFEYAYLPVYLWDGARNLAPGTSHALFVDRYGQVLASGRNQEGQLGDGSQVWSTDWHVAFSIVH